MAYLIPRELKKLYAFIVLKQPGLFLLILSCSVGVFTFREYGFAWDERQQRVIGLFNWNYIFNVNRDLLTFADNDHGVAFELPLILLEKLFGLGDTRSIFLMRHLATHLFFLIGAYFCYKLIFLLYQDKILGCIGFLLFILHPHIYAHSFFNTKDLPFLSMFMICLYFTAKTLQNKTILNSGVLGVCLGLLINMRLMGVMLVCFVLCLLLLDMILEKKIKQNLKTAVFLSFFLVISVYATWPYLWSNPLENFVKAFKSMSHFGWALTNLFNGKYVPANEIGWNYIPVWFSITTPVSYLLAGICGIALCIYFFIKKPLNFFTGLSGKCNLIFLACFISPVIAVIVLKSVMYDGWRHLFFIYPSFVMLIIFALHSFITRYEKTTLTVSLITFLCVAGFMVTNYPFQHVYFNSLVAYHSEPEYLRKHYELDYWGTSYKQSLEYILKKDPSPSISVFAENEPGAFNAECLEPLLRQRIWIVEKEEQAMYLITNYRWHPQDYPFEEKKIYSIKVLDNTINAVYKLR